MNEVTKKRCELLIHNRDRVKEVFPWDGGLIHLACAGILTAKDKKVDEKILASCKQVLKQKVGPFSNFRSTARTAIVSMLAASEHPKQTLDEGLLVYDLLKKRFWSSTHLALAAMIIAQMAESSEYEYIADRTKGIYQRMKSDHPFLTGSGDSAYCALMALSEKSDGELIEDAERCYRILKADFFSADAVQSLSHVLALAESSIEEKTQGTIDLFTKLKSSGHKYGTSYELPTLGVLAMEQGNLEEVVHEMIDIDTWLSKQKGFGFFSGISKKQRLMYAGMLAMKDEVDDDTLQTSAITSTVSLIIAQQAAMMAAIAASSASAANASS
jgi:hypothetical protein